MATKNAPNDRLAADSIDTLDRNCEEINKLEANDRHVATILEKNRCNGSSDSETK